jgi:hypothetical protein
VEASAAMAAMRSAFSFFIRSVFLFFQQDFIAPLGCLEGIHLAKPNPADFLL